MEKINQHSFRSCIYYLCLVSLVFSPISVRADECQCYFCGNLFECEEAIDYEGLGEYEDMFREFEARSDEEEGEFVAKAFFLKKWCKKVKRWFKKTVAKVLKKMINYKKFKSGEHCAYEVAKFKRDVDKKLHNTGDIENMLKEFECGTDDPAYAGMESFRERIRYYYYNKNATPPKHPDHDRYNFCMDCQMATKDGKKKSDLDDIPIRALIGGVEVSCGFLIQVLPFPGCLWLGRALIGHGFSQIYEGYMQQYEEDQKNNPPMALVTP